MRAFLMWALLAVPACAAQTEIRLACAADHARVCTGAMAGPAATACLRQSYVSLSRPCRKALDAARRPATPPGRAPG